MRAGLAALSLTALLAACAPQAPFQLTEAGFGDLPGWAEDDHAAALTAFDRSCAAGAGRSDGLSEEAAPEIRPRTAWRAACDAAMAGPADAKAFFEHWFSPYRVSAAGDTPLITGYYEPELAGSLQRHGPYQVPLYLRPPELVTVDLGLFRDSLAGERIAGRVVDGRLLPYPDRRAIEKGALNGRGLELVWVDNAADAFFLQIQGSGRVRLDDGSVLRIGYAATNGRPYTAIGRTLIAHGEIKPADMSMQTIRDWLARHPAQAAALMRQNASYVFFRQLDGDGPIGAQGVVLTPGRSLAIDPRFHAYGTPVWLDVEDKFGPVRRLLIAQDTGGAIRGPLRGDLFWGFGDAAADRAGGMVAEGDFYVLLPTMPPPGS